MNAHTLFLLEYDRLKEHLRARAPGALGRAAVDALLPAADPEEVRRRQRRTAQMRSFREERDLSWEGSQDISEILEALQADGSWIEGEGLLRIAAFAAAARRVRRALLSREKAAPDLAGLAAAIADTGALAAEINRAINPDGEVSDRATPALSRIRRRIHRTRRGIAALLERLLGDARYEQAFQERIVTQRDGRYLVPVKSGARALVPGVVHDRSASGQTFFVEPREAVEPNNALRELELAEREEVRAVLRRLGAQVRKEMGALREAAAAMGSLEALWAGAGLGMDWKMVQPEILSGESRLDLRGARHPLLVAAGGRDVVPVDVAVGGELRTIVVTGPNTGGKTVVLKTAGLLTLMAQTGLQIPADPGSGLTCFPAVLADIGDEQSLQQSLSTFSGHVRNVVSILAEAGEGALVLLDELGAGTDPSEGAALGIAVLEEAREAGALTIATTHHDAVKVYASSTGGVANASMEFNERTLEPTYRMAVGLPGRSQAFVVAGRLGLPPRIIERARALQGREEVRLDRLMADLEEARDSLERERASFRRERERRSRELDSLFRKLEQRRSELEETGARLLREARRELAAHLRRLKKEGRAGAENVRAGVRRVEDVMKGHLRKEKVPPPPASELLPGARVYLRSLRRTGVVEELSGGRLTVTVDGKKCTLPLAEVELREAAPARPRRIQRTVPGGTYAVEVPPVESSRIDLRGQKAEEATAALEKFLDRAVLAGLPRVEVLHGKGTGRLQDAVAACLAADPRIGSFAPAPLEQGGTGVTWAKLS